MLVIGLTGGIGSGKTTVATLFEELYHIPHIDSDQLARQVVLPETEALASIVEHFGPEILLANGELNRQRLREIIFEAPQERAWLEQLLHPAIRQAMQLALNQLDSAYAFLVIPLLVGRPENPLIQRILVVDATSELQKQRVSLRDKVDIQQIESIIATQTARDHLLQAADDIIKNHGDLNDLKQQIIVLHQKYLELANR